MGTLKNCQCGTHDAFSNKDQKNLQSEKTEVDTKTRRDWRAAARRVHRER